MWKKIKENLIIWLEYNKKYKIKLIFMLTSIFMVFLGTLVYIIYMKTINGIEPVLLNVDTNSILGKIVTTKAFKISSKFLFSYWNFGPSYETLLGLIVLTYVILVIMIILSSYIKIILIPLTIITSWIFYNIYDIIKKEYYIENTIELFNKFGLKLVKNPELPKTFSSSELLENINILKETFIDRAKSHDKICDLSSLDTNKLLNELVEKKYTNWEDVNLYIIDYLKNNIKLTEIDWSTWTSNLIYNIFDNALFTVNKIGSFLVSNPGTTIMFLITISGVVYLYIITNSLQNEIITISNVQDKQNNLIDAVDRKLESVDTTLTESTKELIKTTNNSADLSNEVNNLNDNLKLTNEQVIKLAEGLELQAKGTWGLFDKLVGIDNFDGDIPVSLGDLLAYQNKLYERLLSLKESITKIEEIIKQK